MICPKCGEKYEDDMPRCLWCDAPNPDYTEQMQVNEMTLPNTTSEKACHVKEMKIEIGQKIEQEQNCLNVPANDGFVTYKLSKISHIFNVLGMVFLVCYVLFSIIDWFGNLDVLFVDKMRPLWPIIVYADLLFTFIAYILSKKILAIKWYKDKFVLCTRYGEKLCSFDKSEIHRSGVGRYGESYFIFKKNSQTFCIDERDFPQVMKMLCKIYSESKKKVKKQDVCGTDFVVYESLLHHRSNKLEIVGYCILGFFMLVFCFLAEKMVTSWFVCLLIAIVCFFEALRLLRTVFKIKWYEDKFILCTYFGEKVFLLDRIELCKIKHDGRGNRVLVLKRGVCAPAFVVDERDFPEVIEKIRNSCFVET